MRFRIKVQEEGTGEISDEEYEKDVEDPRKWAEEAVAKFKTTLHPNEIRRKLLDVEILPEPEKPLASPPEKQAAHGCPFCSLRFDAGDDLREHLYDHSKSQMIDALLELLQIGA